MPLTTASVLRRARHVLGVCLLGVLAACVSNPPAAPAGAAGSLPVAVSRLGDDLAGQLNTSILQRMRSRDPLQQMPPLGTRLADPDGLAAVAAWIHHPLPTGKEPQP